MPKLGALLQALWALATAGSIIGYVLLAYWTCEKLIHDKLHTVMDTWWVVGLSFGFGALVLACILPFCFLWPLYKCGSKLDHRTLRCDGEEKECSETVASTLGTCCFCLLFPLMFGAMPLVDVIYYSQLTLVNASSVLDARPINSAFRFMDGYIATDYQTDMIVKKGFDGPSYFYTLVPVFPNYTCAAASAPSVPATHPMFCPPALILALYHRSQFGGSLDQTKLSFDPEADYSCNDEQGAAYQLCAHSASPQWLYMTEKWPMPSRKSEDDSQKESKKFDQGWKTLEVCEEMVKPLRQGTFNATRVCDSMWLAPGDVNGPLAEKQRWARVGQVCVWTIVGIQILAIVFTYVASTYDVLCSCTTSDCCARAPDPTHDPNGLDLTTVSST